MGVASIVHQALIKFTDGYLVYLFVLVIALVFAAITLGINQLLAPNNQVKRLNETHATIEAREDVSYPSASFRVLFNTLNLSLMLVLLIPVSVHFKQLISKAGEGNAEHTFSRAILLLLVFAILGLCFAYLAQRVRQKWRAW